MFSRLTKKDPRAPDSTTVMADTTAEIHTADEFAIVDRKLSYENVDSPQSEVTATEATAAPEIKKETINEKQQHQGQQQQNSSDEDLSLSPEDATESVLDQLGSAESVNSNAMELSDASENVNSQEHPVSHVNVLHFSSEAPPSDAYPFQPFLPGYSEEAAHQETALPVTNPSNDHNDANELVPQVSPVKLGSCVIALVIVIGGLVAISEHYFSALSIKQQDAVTKAKQLDSIVNNVKNETAVYDVPLYEKKIWSTSESVQGDVTFKEQVKAQPKLCSNVAFFLEDLDDASFGTATKSKKNSNVDSDIGTLLYRENTFGETVYVDAQVDVQGTTVMEKNTTVIQEHATVLEKLTTVSRWGKFGNIVKGLFAVVTLFMGMVVSFFFNGNVIRGEEAEGEEVAQTQVKSEYSAVNSKDASAYADSCATRAHRDLLMLMKEWEVQLQRTGRPSRRQDIPERYKGYNNVDFTNYEQLTIADLKLILSKGFAYESEMNENKETLIRILAEYYVLLLGGFTKPQIHSLLEARGLKAPLRMTKGELKKLVVEVGF